MIADSDSLAQAYENQGVVRVRELFDNRVMGRIRQQLDRYIQDQVPTLPQREVTVEADGTTVRNLWRLEKRDPFFLELGQEQSLQTFLGRLLHGEPELAAVETFNKRANVGSGVPPHQDNAYFCRTPADVLTARFITSPARTNKGCSRTNRRVWRVIR